MAKVFERVLLVWGSFNTGEILRRTRFLFCTVAHDAAPRSDCGACSHWNVHRPEHRFRPWIATRTRECSWRTSECQSPRKKRGFSAHAFPFSWGKQLRRCPRRDFPARKNKNALGNTGQSFLVGERQRYASQKEKNNEGTNERIGKAWTTLRTRAQATLCPFSWYQLLSAKGFS